MSASELAAVSMEPVQTRTGERRPVELWFNAIDSLPLAAWLVDRELRLVDCNEAFRHSYREYLACDPELGMPVVRDFARLQPQLAALWEGAYRRTLAGEGHSFVLPGDHPEFRAIEVVVTLHPVRPALGGEVEYCLALSEDTETRLKREYALRASEAQLRAMIEHAPDAITILDMDLGRFVEVNSAAERLFGLDRERLLRSNPWAMSPSHQPDGRPSEEKAREHLDAAMLGEARSFEWMHCNAAGGEIDLEIHLVRLPHRSKRLVLGILRDISERKAAARRDARHLETLIELTAKMPDTAVVRRIEGADGSLRYDYISESMEQITGYSTEELLQIGMEALALPADLAAHRNKRDQARRDGALIKNQLRIRKKSGEIVWIEIAARPTRGHDGEVIWDGVIRDLTSMQAAERQRLYEERRGTQLLLADQERVRRQIAAALQDGAAQSLSAAAYTLDAALEMIRLGRSGDGLRLAEQVQSQLSSAVGALQEVTVDLTPVELHSFGLNDAIRSMASESRARGGPDIQFYSETGGARFAEEVELLIYRVAADGVAATAAGERLNLRLRWRGDRLLLALSWLPSDFTASRCDAVQAIERRARVMNARIRWRERSDGGAYLSLSVAAVPRVFGD